MKTLRIPAHVLTLILTLVPALRSAAAFAGRVEIQGHRGARGLLPENTIPGFERAVNLKVDVLELDVGLTRDGVVLVSHDPVPNPSIVRRKTGGEFVGSNERPWRELNFEETRAFDVGGIKPLSPYALRFPRQQTLPGTRMPALQEVLEWTKRSAPVAVRLNIEVKTDPGRPDETETPEAISRAVIRDLRAAGMEARAVMQSFDFRAIAAARREAPSLVLSCLTAESAGDDTIQRGKPGASPWLNGLDVVQFEGSVPRLVKAAGCSIWSPDYEDVTAGTLAEAHRLGLRVIVWTVNDSSEMRRLAKLGVDGIITDYPDRAIEALRP